ncbi:hypothetical protein CRUP_029661 [Coryphaenoides rupestris]|nr:hypothetical protein CRUP_029661 [Coryphaenoides rupestris]
MVMASTLADMVLAGMWLNCLRSELYLYRPSTILAVMLRGPMPARRLISSVSGQQQWARAFWMMCLLDLALGSLYNLGPVALTGGLGDSTTSRWMDLGRGFFFRLPERGLMTSFMSSISLSCFLLRYSFLM